MSDTLTCPKCKKSNPSSNVACIWCGAMLMYQRLQRCLGFKSR
ncbi:MAG: hypothetical protein AB7I41_24745 [Candidatus Sericytochromatia bacterium]